MAKVFQCDRMAAVRATVPAEHRALLVDWITTGATLLGHEPGGTKLRDLAHAFAEHRELAVSAERINTICRMNDQKTPGQEHVDNTIMRLSERLVSTESFADSAPQELLELLSMYALANGDA